MLRGPAGKVNLVLWSNWKMTNHSWSLGVGRVRDEAGPCREGIWWLHTSFRAMGRKAIPLILVCPPGRSFLPFSNWHGPCRVSMYMLCSLENGPWSAKTRLEASPVGSTAGYVLQPSVTPCLSLLTLGLGLSGPRVESYLPCFLVSSWPQLPDLENEANNRNHLAGFCETTWKCLAYHLVHIIY